MGVNDEKIDLGIRDGGDRLGHIRPVETLAEHKIDDVIGAFEVKKTRPNAPKISGEMPQIPQAANAPNAPNVTFENTEFARPTGWGKLWRMERNGVYFRYRLRFTNSGETPQEFQRVTRQGGKISPKIERALSKRPGKGRHEVSRIEAGRFRSRALDIAGRIRSGAGRGNASKSETYRGDPDTPALPSDPSLVRGHMPQLPGVDGADEMPGVWKSDRVM
jgi:hypothetical protein